MEYKEFVNQLLSFKISIDIIEWPIFQEDYQSIGMSYIN